VDIVKALALGANAVMICRPFATMWFGGGASGIKFYMEMLQRELKEAMYMVGARKTDDLNPEMLRFT
jgi:isopentenyl diphosphate isomerase/L-lactate dehydrogenase-like FMN-dependent dehydrogenase